MAYSVQDITWQIPSDAISPSLTGKFDLYLDPEVVRTEYQRKLENHNQRVEIACRQLGIAFHRLQTDRPLELALLDFLRSRSRRGKRVHRRNQTGTRS